MGWSVSDLGSLINSSEWWWHYSASKFALSTVWPDCLSWIYDSNFPKWVYSHSLERRVRWGYYRLYHCSCLLPLYRSIVPPQSREGSCSSEKSPAVCGGQENEMSVPVMLDYPLLSRAYNFPRHPGGTLHVFVWILSPSPGLSSPHGPCDHLQRRLRSFYIKISRQVFRMSVLWCFDSGT